MDLGWRASRGAGLGRLRHRLGGGRGWEGAWTAHERRNSAALTTSATIVHGARSCPSCFAIYDLDLDFCYLFSFLVVIFLECGPNLHLNHRLLYGTVLNHGTAL
jgi:hypothetical protein